MLKVRIGGGKRLCVGAKFGQIGESGLIWVVLKDFAMFLSNGPRIEPPVKISKTEFAIVHLLWGTRELGIGVIPGARVCTQST